MTFSDLPPQIQERVVCSISAAGKYSVPAHIVLAVAEKEGGKPGQWIRNANGTHDVGPMQFNTAYLAELKRFGITVNDVAAAGCYSFDLAAWRLRKHIRNDKGDIWTRAANYHSRTPRYNAAYRADLIRKASKWAEWLETHFMPPLAQTARIRMPDQATTAGTPTYTQKQTIYRTNNSAYVPRKITFRSDQDVERSSLPGRSGGILAAKE